MRALLRWCAVLVGAWCCGALATRFAPTPDGRWVTEVVAAKRARLHAIGPAPRVLIVGGSSAYFGVDAALIQRTCGGRVVNLATHAGLGLAVMLDVFSDEWHDGDTVVVNIEYGLLEAPEPDEEMGVSFALRSGRPLLGAIGPRETARRLAEIGSPGLTDVLRGAGLRVLGGRAGRLRLGGYGTALGPAGDALEPAPVRRPLRSIAIGDPHERELAHLRAFVARA